MDIDIEIPSDERRALALDKRVYSPDGFLTATDCVISAAQVNPYLGRELPDAESLGLDPERVYAVYRDPVALKAAVPLFNGLPVIVEHSVITSANFDRVPVGAVHDCRWESGRVMGSVSVWPQPAIDDIETKVRSDLSAGYWFKPVLGAGRTPSGEAFDLRMADIRPQHVALVVDGRVRGAAVADSRPRLAADQRARIERLIPHYDRL